MMMKALIHSINKNKTTFPADSALDKCSKAETQNPNESFHSLIWSMCSKQMNASRQQVTNCIISCFVLQFNTEMSAYIQHL